MEVYLLFSWIADAPIVGLLYLAATVLLGFVCISIAKVGFAEIIQHVAQTRRGELLPESMRVLLVLGKMWVVGALLIFPGYLSDILAALIWFFIGKGRTERGGAADAPIEVQARVYDD